MNKLLLFLTAMTLTIVANAGTAKISWTSDYKATDGSLITLTGFKVYYAPSGQPKTNVVDLENPAPWPYKSVGGLYYYAKTLTDAAWMPGSVQCFEMTALGGGLESVHTGQVCKTFPLNPLQPVIIDIITQ